MGASGIGQSAVDLKMGNDFKSLYEIRFSESNDYRRKVWSILVSDWFSRYIPTDASVLDLGCGYGQFINQVQARRRYAMDLNPDSMRSMEADVQLFEQDCSTRWPLPDNHLDLVLASNFFEHLPSKSSLEAALREAWRCLRPEGRIIALGPNIKYVDGAYWDYWDHHLPLTDSSMAEGFQLSGFRIEEKVARFLPLTILNGPDYPLIFLRAYLRLPFVWPIFGQQYLVVAKK